MLATDRIIILVADALFFFSPLLVYGGLHKRLATSMGKRKAPGNSCGKNIGLHNNQ
jgi:hypothetical protein